MIEKRLPGKPRPQAEALAEYRTERGKCPPDRLALWPLLVGDEGELYRWRVLLDCGCVREVMTHGPDRAPCDRQWHGGSFPESHRLPVGQLRCVEHSIETPPYIYREITEWRNRRVVDHPADPIEPPSHWADAPDLWAAVRLDEPRSSSAFWTVTLECGHLSEVSTDLDWKPEDGPRRATPQRQAEMLAEFDASGPPEDEEAIRMRRMIELGWPLPQPDQMCTDCTVCKTITAYERIGWLSPREKQGPKRDPSAPPSRATLKRRLREAEREAKRLRDQLGEAET